MIVRGIKPSRGLDPLTIKELAVGRTCGTAHFVLTFTSA